MDTPATPAEDYQRIFNLVTSIFRSEGAVPSGATHPSPALAAVIIATATA